VLYFENYIVLEPGLTPLKERQLLTEDEYLRRRTSMARTPSPAASAPRRSADARDLDLEKMSASSCARSLPRPSPS
jgi:DNA-directed RNA polymerase subunit beta'